MTAAGSQERCMVMNPVPTKWEKDDKDDDWDDDDDSSDDDDSEF